MYSVELIPGVWKIGDREFSNHESVDAEDAIHLINASKVVSSDHPRYAELHGKKKGRPATKNVAENKLAAAKRDFINGPFKSVKAFAEKKGIDYNWLVKNKAMEWEMKKRTPTA